MLSYGFHDSNLVVKAIAFQIRNLCQSGLDSFLPLVGIQYTMTFVNGLGLKAHFIIVTLPFILRSLDFDKNSQ